MTAAEPKLPLRTQVTVSSQDSGKAIKVEVNDRGPYVDGRDIDLSKGAGKGSASSSRRRCDRART
jgi:rare lipoprotein A